MNDLAATNAFQTGRPADADAWSQGPHDALLTIGTDRLVALKDEKVSLAGVISGLLSAADDELSMRRRRRAM